MNSLNISCRVRGVCVCVTLGVLAALLAGCGRDPASPARSASAAPAQKQAADDTVLAADTDTSVSPAAETAADTAAADTAAADTAAANTAAADAAVDTAAVPPAQAAEGTADTMAVGSCDGENTVTVVADARGQELADSLMEQWLRDHPEADWVAEEKEKHTLQPPADNSDLLAVGQAAGHPYGNFTEKDILLWARETEKFAVDGSRIFHSGDLLGSTVGVSCDMCHPHASNTHPETYPKYQTQLGRVVLLRDMINWCIENPVRGEKLDQDGPTMRALEAYIMAQRKGVPMNYGKH